MDKDSGARLGWWHLLVGLLFALSVHAPAVAEDAPSISTMLKEGWQIAGTAKPPTTVQPSSYFGIPTKPI